MGVARLHALRTNEMAIYTAEEVVQLLDEHETYVDVVCMEGSDDELDFKDKGGNVNP